MTNTSHYSYGNSYVAQTKRGRTARVPLLVGTNKDEGTLIVEGEPTAYLSDIVKYTYALSHHLLYHHP